MFYLAGYLSKNPIKPAHWVSCIVAARRAAAAGGSTADDAGTKIRTATYVLQKVLNKLNALGEIADTQAAMMLLRNPSFVSSHEFRFVFIQPAVAYQISLIDGADDAYIDADKETVEANDNDQHVEEDGAAQPANPDGIGGAVVYTDEKGLHHSLSQHHHYRWRVGDWDATLSDGTTPDLRWWYIHVNGTVHPEWNRVDQKRGLESLCLLEYVRHVTVVPMPRDGHGPPPRTRGGVRYYYFNRDHPLHRSHIQRLSTKHYVPVLSGTPAAPPTGTVPPTDSRKRAAWHVKGERFGAYMGTLLSPWDRRGRCGVLTYAAWINFRKHLLSQSQAGNPMSATPPNNPSNSVAPHPAVDNMTAWVDYLNRSRDVEGDDLPPECGMPDPRPMFLLDYAHNVGKNMRLPEKLKDVVNAWRNEHSDKFSKEDQVKAMRYGAAFDKDCATSADNQLAIARWLSLFVYTHVYSYMCM